MARPPLNPEKTPSGIALDPHTLERVIPESRRADGSIRKQLKVRPGFTPQEDVRRFRGTRQSQMDANALPKGHIIGWVPPSSATQKPSANAFPALGQSSASSSNEKSLSKAAKKNAKRKEKREEKRVDPVKDNWEDDDDEDHKQPLAAPTEVAEITLDSKSTKEAKPSIDTKALEAELKKLDLS